MSGNSKFTKVEMPRSTQDVNELTYDQFIQVFGNVVECCTLCAAAVWAHRPFKNAKELHAHICTFIDDLPTIGREAILRLHPDLAGRGARLGLLSSESSQEQFAAELNTLSDEERNTLTALNERYKQKFGFTFTICARENKKNAILNGLKTRVENTLDVEIQTGIEEVKKIVWHRLLDLVQNTD